MLNLAQPVKLGLVTLKLLGKYLVGRELRRCIECQDIYALNPKKPRKRCGFCLRRKERKHGRRQ